MKITAAIFDMDGVISDTQRFHAQVESELLARFGIYMEPDEITAHFAGRATEEWLAEVLAEHNKKVGSIDALVFEKWNLMAAAAKGNIQEINGASELIRALKTQGFKLAVASSSTKQFIAEVLEELKLVDYFDATVSAQEVAQGKPAPDIFLLAAERIGAAPEQAVVIEDGRSGMLAACAAHMPSIGLVDDTSSAWPATRLVTSLTDVHVADLQSL